MVKFKDFSRPLSVFQYFLRQIYFSRTFQDSPVYSSTFSSLCEPGLFMLPGLQVNNIKDYLNSGFATVSLKSIMQQRISSNKAGYFPT